MATQARRKASKSKPIVANPLFPAVVALWFGALFGLSSLAVRVSLIESAVRFSRIDLFLGAAAPPLGTTARILVALLMAALGALIGATIAKWLARPKTAARERTRTVRRAEQDEPAAEYPAPETFEAPIRRPISAHEELSLTARVDPGPAIAGRRRSLTIPDGELLAEVADYGVATAVPASGHDHAVLELAGAELEPPAGFGQDWPASDAPTPAADLNAFENGVEAPAPLAEAPMVSPFAPPVIDRIINAAAAAPVDLLPGIEADDDAMAGRQVFGQDPVAPPASDSRQIFGSQPAEVSGIAPLPPVAEPAEPAAPAPFALPEPEPVAVAPRETLPPLDELGLVDLALRLQQSMERRRAARSSTGAPAPGLAAAIIAPPQRPDVPAEPVQVEPEMPAFTLPPIDRLPAALRPISLDEAEADGEDDAVLSSLLPPRHLGDRVAQHIVPPAGEPVIEAPSVPGTPDESEPDEAEGYASLLDAAPLAPRPAFVRIEEPAAADETIEPVVIFPGQGSRVAMQHGIAADRADVPPVASPEPHGNDGLRRFDAPPNAGPGHAISAASAPAARDPEETARALRAALSSLQRISGAA